MKHPFLRLEPQVSRHERVGATDAPVVEVGPVLPSNLQDVSESCRDDERSIRSLSFKKSVCSYRRTVNEEVDPVGGNAMPVHQFADSGSYSEGLVDRCGRGLCEFEAVGIGVVESEVGEGSPDIDPQSVAHGCFFLAQDEYGR